MDYQALAELLFPQVPEDGLCLPDLGLVLETVALNENDLCLDSLALPGV